jgi:hypothetical protein
MLPRSMWAVRWALAAAFVSMAICISMMLAFQRVDLRAGKIGTPASIAAPRMVEPAPVATADRNMPNSHRH